MNWILSKRVDFFKYSLILFFITIPMPKYSLNMQSFGVVVFFWLLLNPSKDFLKTISQQWKYLACSMSFFFFILIGVLFSEDKLNGLRYVFALLPFLLLPIIFITNTKLLPNNFVLYLLKVFSVSTVIMCVFALFKSFFIYYFNLGSYFFYDRLAIILDKHTTYFSLFIMISITYFYYALLNKKVKYKAFTIVAIFFLIFYLYLLSSRISILALTIFCFFVIKDLNIKLIIKTIISFITILSIFLVLRYSSNFNNRFNSYDSNVHNEVSTRMTHWKSALQTIRPQEYIFGKGTGSGKDGLYNQYLRNNFEVGYKNKYNCHNQYLEFFMSNGLIGVITYLILLINLLIMAIKSKNKFALLVTLYIIIYGITESILERQSGIIIVSLFSSLLLFSKLDNKNNQLK